MYERFFKNEICPDTLFDICLRAVSKDIHNIQPNNLKFLPSYIKRNILKYATRYVFQREGRGFKNEQTLKALLDSEVTNLELTNSVTTDYTLQNITEQCTALKELIVGGTNCTLTEIAFQTFVPQMTNLTFLSLEGLDYLIDSSITGLIFLEHLKNLNLKKCTGLTDDCGLTLRNIKLERLDMSYTLITDVWVDLLEFSLMNKYLIELNLSYCKNLTDTNINMLNWSTLKCIGLFGITGLEFMDNLGNIKNVQWTIPF